MNNKKIFLGKILEEKNTSNIEGKYLKELKFCPSCNSKTTFTNICYQPKLRKGLLDIEVIDECDICGYMNNKIEPTEKEWKKLSLEEKNNIISSIPGVPKDGDWHLNLCDAIEEAVKTKNT